jgi:glycosyltransferase involved in cell wall biosynthesis
MPLMQNTPPAAAERQAAGPKPRILLLFQFPYLISGNNSSFLHCGRALSRDFEVHYALPEPTGIFERLTAAERARTTIVPPGTSLADRIRRTLSLLRLLRRRRIGIVVHTFLYDSSRMILLKLLTGASIVLYFGASRMTWRHRLLSHFYDRILLKSHQIRTVSLERRRKLERIPFRTAALAEFDSSLFSVRAAAHPRSRPVHSDRIVLGYMGRIDNEVKGLYDLVNAVALLRLRSTVTLRIMGDVVSRKPHEKQLLVEWAAAAGVREHLEFRAASAAEEDKRRFFEGIDVFCLPSLAEGTPNVVFEAISHAVPVVATRCGSLPVYFDDRGEILYVREQDPEDLAAKIEALIDDTTLYAQLGRGMRRFVERIESQDLAGKLVDLFRTI